MNNKYITKNTELSINAIKLLGVDMINSANSGHPGIVLGAAPIMYSLFRNHLVVNPSNPYYFNRDRFVLSAGHGSALLYATMHLCGYKISLESLKNFRQLNSSTAGHPERILIPGIDASTGPLGQGVANAVGMAIAQAYVAKIYNTDKFDLINHYVYCLFGDGCMQEGIFDEAISIAGRYKLNRLILLYDSNNIQLDGPTSDSTKIDNQKYFESKGFNYLFVDDGSDVVKISQAIETAKGCNDKPSVIEIKTIIGKDSLNQNSSKTHGSPLSKEDIDQLRTKLNFPYEPFNIPQEVYDDFKIIKQRGLESMDQFEKQFASYKNQPNYQDFLKLINNSIEIDEKWFDNLSIKPKEATRNICGQVVETIFDNIKNALILNADLSGSTKVKYSNSSKFDYGSYDGRNINIGVREFAMNAINNGISSYGGIRAIGSTFLAFSDYNKAAIRLAAISEIPMISVYSHDSITVGEDGPTHQPVEQIWALRLIPNHYLFRPASLNETIAAFKFGFESKNSPVTIITSRSEFDQYNLNSRDIRKGGYLISESPNYDLSIIATGSEVGLAFEVKKILKEKYQLVANVISMPCLNLFEEQTSAYKEKILGNKPLYSIEFGSTTPWYRYVDYAFGIDVFGKSSKPNELIKLYNLSPFQIAYKIYKIFKK